MVIHDVHVIVKVLDEQEQSAQETRDRKSTRLNSSHSQISYAVFCLKKKNTRCKSDLTCSAPFGRSSCSAPWRCSPTCPLAPLPSALPLSTSSLWRKSHSRTRLSEYC